MKRILGLGRLRAVLLLSAALVVPACDEGDTILMSAPADFVPQVLFQANPTTLNRFDVFAADFTGTGPVNLTRLPGGSSLGWLWSPDRSRLAFSGERDTAGVVELYVMPVEGGEPLKLSGTMVAGGDVVDYAWSPDSSRIAFLADREADEVYELYTVTPAGSGLTKVSGTLVAGGDVASGLYLAWSPDSARLAYLADQDTDGVKELYTTPPAGGAVKVSRPVVAVGGQTYAFLWAPNSARLAYLGDLDVLSRPELYTVQPTGTGEVKMSGTLPPGSAVGSFDWAPNSSRILYRADQDTPGVIEIYSSLAAGGGNVKLNGALPATATVNYQAWSPDSSRVAYLADQDAAGTLELYSVPAAGGAGVKLSGAMTPGGGAMAFNLRWSPDGTRVAYAADQDVDGKLELYTSLAAGGGNVKVSAPMSDDSDVRDQFYYWAPDSSRILYQIEIYNPLAFTLSYQVRTAAAAGSGHALVSSSLSSMLFWTGDSSRVVFTAQDVVQINLGDFVYGPMELFTARPDGSEPTRLSGTMTPTSNHVVYSAVVR